MNSRTFPLLKQYRGWKEMGSCFGRRFDISDILKSMVLFYYVNKGRKLRFMTVFYLFTYGFFKYDKQL